MFNVNFWCGVFIGCLLVTAALKGSKRSAVDLFLLKLSFEGWLVYVIEFTVIVFILYKWG